MVLLGATGWLVLDDDEGNAVLAQVVDNLLVRRVHRRSCAFGVGGRRAMSARRIAKSVWRCPRGPIGPRFGISTTDRPMTTIDQDISTPPMMKVSMQSPLARGSSPERPACMSPVPRSPACSRTRPAAWLGQAGV